MPFTSKSYSCGSLGRVRKLLNLNHGNWVNVPVPQAASVTLLDIETDPTNGDKVFTVGEAEVVNPTSFYGVAVSSNGGTTWTIPGGNYQAAVLSKTNMGATFKWNEIIVVNSTLSFIVGSVNLITRFATIAMSTDGGLNYNLVNWQSNCTPDPTAAGLSEMEAFSVHFPNSNIGVVGLHNFVIKTTDGGGTWTIMNNGTALSTASFPNPPGTALPIGDITGIHIKADQSVVTAVGAEFIAITEPVSSPNPAGMLADSWKNNFVTSNSPGSPPIYSGFTPNLPIGWHLGGMQPPNDNVIWVSGDSSLGIHSGNNGTGGWTTPPGIGWNQTGSGFSRRAAHFYKYTIGGGALNGFYNQSTGAANDVYWNNVGFNPGGAVLSDTLPGLNYAPTAIWTWYEETPEPTCYTLTDCDTGDKVYTTVNLSAYINPPRVIQVSEFPGKCFHVTEGCPQPNTPQTVTYVADFADCDTCSPPQNPCACPPGTTEVTLPDGSKACREDIVVPALGPAPGFCQQIALGITANQPPFTPGLWGQSPQYCRYGARFYGETSGLPWPISFNTGCTPGSQTYLDFSSNPVPAIGPNVVNSLWGDGTGYPFGPYNGRFNVAGVTFDPNLPCPGGIAAGYYGFTYCLNVATTTTYSIGFGGRNIRILINGFVWIDSTALDNFNYEVWNVMQITLPPGNYIILMSSELGGGPDSCSNFTFNSPNLSPRNAGSTPGMAFEIYKASAAALSAMTSFPPGVLVYSTQNEFGQPIDYGQSVFNYRCNCPPPPETCPDAFGNYNVILPVLDNCTVNALNPNADPHVYVCHTYKYTPISGCCYLLRDCQNQSITHVTSTDLSIYVLQNKVIKVSEYQGCFTVEETDCPQGVPPPPTVTVTSSYADCPSCLPKCYKLTDCNNNLPSFIVNDDLSLYLLNDTGVIYVCPPNANRIGGDNTQNFTDQIVLTDCCNPNNKVRGNPSSATVQYYGKTILWPALGTNCWIVDSAVSSITVVGSIPSAPMNWNDPAITVKQGCTIDCPPCSVAAPVITECTCFIIELAQGCTGSISLSTVGTITSAHPDCDACDPDCYRLVNCEDSNEVIITDTDLSGILGQVIYIDGCPGKCWQIFLSDTCDGKVSVTIDETFADCDTCLGIQPPPPVELRPRMIKPGYTTPGCDPEYTERVNCTFSNAAYDQMLITRYGITMCCNEPIEKWDIKKQLLDLRAIYDPDLCKNTFETCCPPCAVVATLTVYNPTPVCQPPTGVVATLNIPVPVCPAPTNVQAGIIINPTQPCVCYMITISPGMVCTFEFVDCYAVPGIATLFGGINYLCSISVPTTLCDPAAYTIQSTPSNCANGECGRPSFPCSCHYFEGASAPGTISFTDCAGGPQVLNILPGMTGYICGSGLTPSVAVTITVLPNSCALNECHA